MTVPTSVQGHGPDIVLLHGVGVGPATFDATARHLASDHRVLVPERPGDSFGAVPLAEQADAVAAAILEHSAGGARLVGVSGGATLGLVVALRHRTSIGSLVLHEPLLGRLVPSLHERFNAAARQAGQGDDSALEVVRLVLGAPTWERLDVVTRVAIEAEAPRARHEVSVFAAFDPTVEEIASLAGLPMLTTVGSESPPERHEVVLVLERLAGAERAVLEGSGNAAQIDAAKPFADLVRGWRPAVRIGA